MSWREHKLKQAKARTNDLLRLKVLAVFFILFAGVLILRLFDLQILKGGFYAALAVGQHELYQKLIPERGSIYVMESDGVNHNLYPLVDNQELDMLYAVPYKIHNPEEVAQQLFDIFGLPSHIKFEDIEEELYADISPDLEPDMAAEIKAARKQKWLEEQRELEITRITTILAKENDPYEPLYHKLTEEQSLAVEALEVDGLAFRKETWRLYPEQGIGGHLFGFWGFNEQGERVGRYGLEGYYDELLTGQYGEIHSERDAWGNIIAIGSHRLTEKQDGADLVLTIDRAIQYKACQALYAGVEKSKAQGGTIIVLNPKTGAVLAMCGAPDYDPDNYADVDEIEVYNNPATFGAYEPGSIFKPITMAAALDAGAVDPYTTYLDTGEIIIGPDRITNFEYKSYGQQTMTNVLEKSINTGVIYAMRQIGPDVFSQYLQNFGFGEPTGIEIGQESGGNIYNLMNQSSEIYAATASFGQGITVTPLQIVNAIAAVANDGKLMRPHIVSQIIHSQDEVETTQPELMRQVISPKAATMLMGMLVSVVENGHGKAAAVKGYRVGGKTGTAQVASTIGRGYSGEVITSFVGFAPFSDPRFAMIVRVDKPQWGHTGAAVAAPIFQDVAEFILQYYNVPYDAQ